MIFKRVVSALSVALVATLGFMFIPLYMLFPLLLVASCLCQAEFYIMAMRKYPVAPYAGTLMGVIWMSFVFVFPMFSLDKSGAAWSVTFVPVLLFAFFVYVLFARRMNQPLVTIATTVLGFVYIPFLMSFFLRVVQLTADRRFGIGEPGAGQRQGLLVLLFIVAVVKLSDMGGFAFGKAFGRHKLAPTISPNKSWEGLFGGILGSVLASVGFYALAAARGWGQYCEFWNHLTYSRAVITGVLLACAGTLGDLIESRFKRDCGVKDSSSFLPAGMGGFLDMFDSLLFAPALFYPYLYYCLVTVVPLD